MKKFTKTLALFFFLMVYTISVVAQDAKISIQGTLKDASGASVSDGTYSVDFKLYHVPTGGTEQWVETANVIVTGGIYSHYLGSVEPLNPSIFGQTLYMGVNVNNFELEPRTELTYAPYTFASSTVSCSGAVGDVKYSILDPTQFAAVNGDCWVPMDGGDMTGSILAGITGQSNVPDMSGLFIRAQEYNNGNDPDRTTSSPIATFQADALKSHTHSYGDSYLWKFESGEGAGAFPSVGTMGRNGNAWVAIREPDHIANGYMDNIHFYNTISSETTNSSTGGTETRSKNRNFYIYIRINN